VTEPPATRPHGASLREDRASVVDVTLRDGGYMNDWRFSMEVIEDLVRGIDRAGVDFIELGYIDDDASKAPLLRCTAQYLAEIRGLCRHARVVAMLSPGSKSDREIDGCLGSRSDVLDVVRITALPENVSRALDVAAIARRHDVGCSINLISITAYSPEDLLTAVARVASAGGVDWLYLADSRGALTPQAAAPLFASVRAAWPGAAGFHGHANIGAAVQNSRIALGAGFDLIDGSLGGYGLGGGNTELVDVLRLARPGGSDHASLLKQMAEAVARELPPRPAYGHLYPLSGEKNLEQEWVPEIWRAYGPDSARFLSGRSALRYRHIDELLGVGHGDRR
jgi:4-hydroxy 2-oxovalerate aldolase